MITKPKNIDKWPMIVKMDKVEGPLFGNFDAMKFLNTIKVQLTKIDDPNIVVNVQNFDDVKTCYFTKMLDLSTIQEAKTLYIFL